LAGVRNLHAALEAVGRTHRDRADFPLPKVLLNLEGEFSIFKVNGERIEDRRLVSFSERAINNRTDHLGNCSWHVRAL
jgi:hypothetical protein